MQVKLKTCAGCGKDKPIYKCILGKKMCRGCTLKLEPPKKILNRSVKRIAKDRIYSDDSVEFKQEHPLCELKLPGCTIYTEDVHHLYSGKDRDKYYLDVSTWKAACRHCHTSTHNDYTSDELVEMELKLIDY